MTFPEYEELLRGVSYKPGWTLTLRPASAGFATLDIQVTVLESIERARRMTIAQSYHFHLDDWVNECRFYAFVRDSVLRVEQHEQNEFFRVKGDPWPSACHAGF